MSQIIHSHTFKNGLTLLVEPMTWLESAAFTVLTPAGSAYDPSGKAGRATLLAELMTRGAGERDNRQFVTDLDNLGVDHGEGVQAAHLSFSGSTVAANLLPALGMYADVLRRPLLPKDELEASRQAMLQDLKGLEDEPSQKVMVELRRRFYPDPWGRPSDGEMADVERLKHSDAKEHFKLVRPEGTIVSIAGNIDFEPVKDHVEKLLGDWQGPQIDPPAYGPRGVKRDHLQQDVNQTQIAVAYSIVPYRHEDYFQAWGAVGVLSSGMSARLFTEVREKRGLCYSVYAVTHSLKDHGGVLCYSGTSSERAQETLDVLLAELRRLKDGVLPEELKRLKARMKSSLIMQQESSASRSSSMAREWHHLGRVRTLAETAALVDGLTAESISTYLAANPPEDFTIVTLGPKPLEAN